MKFTFTIPGRLPSLNQVLNTARGSKFAAAREKETWTKKCAKAARLAGLGSLMLPGPVRVSIRWVEKNRRRDPDNVTAGGCKHLLDGLVEAGVLKDDSRRYVRDLVHEFPEPDPVNPRIEVTIETLPGAAAQARLFDSKGI